MGCPLTRLEGTRSGVCLFGRWVAGRAGWLAGWLAGLLVDWLVDWFGLFWCGLESAWLGLAWLGLAWLGLAGWLVGWLVVSFGCTIMYLNLLLVVLLFCCVFV